MRISQILSFLSAAEASVPKLNIQLAILIGYIRVPHSDPKIKARWYDPKGNEITVIPDFTGSIDEARAFMDALVPANVGGFIVGPGAIRAQANDEEPVAGATPALALCIAALSWKMKHFKV